MPTSEKGRRAAFAELKRRQGGKKSKSFEGMDDDELDTYAHAPLHKKQGKMSAGAQASAIKSAKYRG